MSSFPDLPDAAFLASDDVLRLLVTHPNDDDAALACPAPCCSWVALVRQYASPESPELPVIASTRSLQLPRAPIPIRSPLRLPSEQGMSPKKIHQVTRMATYVVRLLRANRLPPDVRIVDVGAGQGYLTRALKSHLPNAHILALDADEKQTRGAQKWEQRPLPNAAPPIAHKTVLITPRNLVRVIDQWVVEENEPAQLDAPVPVLLVALHACGSLTPDVLRAYLASVHNLSSSPPWTPVGVVAVGCCYNLMTPGDFPLSRAYRAFEPLLSLPPSAFHLAAQIPSEWLLPPSKDAPDAPRKTLPSVELAVRKVTWRALLGRVLKTASQVEPSSPHNPTPCSSDIPSTTTKKATTVPAHWPRRPENWPSCPSTASDTPDTNQPSKPQAQPERTLGTGQTPTLVRLGKLPASAYASWAAFIRAVEQRLCVKFPEGVFGIPVGLDSDSDLREEERGKGDGKKDDEKTKANGEKEQEDEDWLTLERHLAALHVLRCLLGPLVESVILRDRVRWVREELGLDLDTNVAMDGDGDRGEGEGKNNPRVRVELVNLFDQATGSGRNVAIAIAGVLPDFGP